MDERAAKLAAARQMLKHHQEKNMARPEYANSYHQNSHIMEKEPMQNIENAEIVNVDNTITHSVNSNLLSSKNCAEAMENDINVTEILISNKTRLEGQVESLKTQLIQLEHNYKSALEQHSVYSQNVSHLERELQTVQDNYATISEENSSQKNIILELQHKTTLLSDEYNNLLEQLEFTKTLLTVKENENSQLNNHISVLQNQLDALQLQIKQLTDHSNAVCFNEENKSSYDELYQKIANLEQQLQSLQKEKDGISSHYEHYVSELSRQLKEIENKNCELTQETNRLYNRENSLVDQISEMEIRLQNYHIKKDVEEKGTILDLQETIRNNEKIIQELNAVNNELQVQYQQCLAHIEMLNKNNKTEYDQDIISISKLHADITSDKIAAQRATEQNKKLKTDLEELEFAFVKMSGDKLNLTERLTHEKHLNQELMLKLAEVEETMKLLQSKLMAKDEEMIRLQNSCRVLERDNAKSIEKYPVKEKKEIDISSTHPVINFNEAITHDHDKVDGKKDLIDSNKEEIRLSIAKEDAMLKLQERFLNIMDEVANLSDEKHRLEHIILQLQNETDTICEYITLYQQQRSLLKKRDEDRSEQINMFQRESDKLRQQLDELNNLLLKFSKDKELIAYLQDESRKNDIDKIMNLLFSLRNSFLVSTNYKSLDFKTFYPCNCCSGQLIDL